MFFLLGLSLNFHIWLPAFWKLIREGKEVRLKGLRFSPFGIDFHIPLHSMWTLPAFSDFQSHFPSTKVEEVQSSDHMEIGRISDILYHSISNL